MKYPNHWSLIDHYHVIRLAYQPGPGKISVPSYRNIAFQGSMLLSLASPLGCMAFISMLMETSEISVRPQEGTSTQSEKTTEHPMQRWPFKKKINKCVTSTQERHVGDLGNILTPGVGKTTIQVSDRFALLDGKYSIIGKAIVIHEGINNLVTNKNYGTDYISFILLLIDWCVYAGIDDLGLGGDTGSLKTGNAGARAACCIIVETFPLFSWKYVMSLMTTWGFV